MIEKLLFLGDIAWGTQCLQRFDAIRMHVGHGYGVDTRMFAGDGFSRGLWAKVQIRAGLGPAVKRTSDGLLREAARYRPQVVWVESGLCLSQEAIMEVKSRYSTVFVHFTADSLLAPGWNNRCFPRALPRYDLCIGIKAREREMYKAKGARRLLVVRRGYDPRINRPVELGPEDLLHYGCDVSFAGQRMEARARSLVQVVEKAPCRLNLYGRQWAKGATGKTLAPFSKGWAYAEDYNKALCGSKIALGFLNREVGDTYTGRSIEVPAARTFMLAERTDDHLELFQEDVQAAFFGSDEELVEKVRFYLSRDALREKIALAGHQRIRDLQVTWSDIMRTCLDEIERIP